jgi:hypothetical protein
MHSNLSWVFTSGQFSCPLNTLNHLVPVDGDHVFYVRFSSLGAGFPGSGYTGLKLLSGGK